MGGGANHSFASRKKYLARSQFWENLWGLNLHVGFDKINLVRESNLVRSQF